MKLLLYCCVMTTLRGTETLDVGTVQSWKAGQYATTLQKGQRETLGLLRVVQAFSGFTKHHSFLGENTREIKRKYANLPHLQSLTLDLMPVLVPPLLRPLSRLAQEVLALLV